MINAKLEQAVADAKVAITDLNMNSINTSSSLRVKRHLNELAKHLAILEKHRNLSWFGRLRDAMFDTAEDRERDEAIRQVLNLTYQINNCLRCRCITCPIIDSDCRCEGCLYGSHVAACEGGTGIESRQVAKGVYMVEGQPAVSAEYHRGKRETTITLLDRNDVERRYWFDPATGKMRPL
jgi:hypothetical protein